MLRIDPGPPAVVVARTRAVARPQDLAAAGANLWVLDGRGRSEREAPARLVSLDGELTELWRRRLPGEPRHLLPAGRALSWVDDRERAVLRRFGGRDVRPLERRPRGLFTAPTCLVALTAPEVGDGPLFALASHGAVWICDARTGRAIRSQGGFEGVVALATGQPVGDG